VDRPLTVVKLGGSLLGSGDLPGLLAGLARRRDARLAIVPGGGVFADAVRTAQRLTGFDDALAHRLALDAMGRMAEVLASLEPRLTVAASLEAIGHAHVSGRMPVWDPAALKEGRPGIPESWSVTSDSLALWLAAEIGAERLVLVKSAPAPADASPEALAASGLVDAAFPAFARRFSGEIVVRCIADGVVSVLAGSAPAAPERMPA
jgi:aspartokinase-like uncharacterized kinase